MRSRATTLINKKKENEQCHLKTKSDEVEQREKGKRLKKKGTRE